MTWATACGLVAIFAIASLCTRLWTNHCKAQMRKTVEKQIKEYEDALAKAIDDDADNTAEHLRLCVELDRLRDIRDSL